MSGAACGTAASERIQHTLAIAVVRAREFGGCNPRFTTAVSAASAPVNRVLGKPTPMLRGAGGAGYDGYFRAIHSSLSYLSTHLVRPRKGQTSRACAPDEDDDGRGVLLPERTPHEPGRLGESRGERRERAVVVGAAGLVGAQADEVASAGGYPRIFWRTRQARCSKK